MQFILNLQRLAIFFCQKQIKFIIFLFVKWAKLPKKIIQYKSSQKQIWQKIFNNISFSFLSCDYPLL